MSVHSLREKLSSTVSTSAKARATLERLLPAARAERDQRVAAVERLREERPELLLREDDSALRRLDQRLVDEQRERDRATAVVELAEGTIAASLKLEPGRRQRFDAVLREVPAAKKWLAERYPKLAAELVKGAEMLRQIEVQIADVNHDLPVGEEPLESVDAMIRGVQAPPLAETLVLPALTGGQLNFWPPRSASSWQDIGASASPSDL